MRLHFNLTINLDHLYDDVKTQQVGAVHLPKLPVVPVMIDLYDTATPAQIEQVINKAENHSLVLIKKEAGTFVVK